MRVPGRAWLEFVVEPSDAGSLVHQTAIFDARGLWGRLYWWGVLPLHAVIFKGMLRKIVERGVERAQAPAAASDAPAP
jgi:hypothetical protein